MASLQALALRASLGRSKPSRNGEPLPAQVTAAVQAALAESVDAHWELASGTDDFRSRLENNILLLGVLKLLWSIVSSVRSTQTACETILSLLRAEGIGNPLRKRVVMSQTSKGSVADSGDVRTNATAGGVVACTCGKTKVILATRVPRLRLECCC